MSITKDMEEITLDSGDESERKRANPPTVKHKSTNVAIKRVTQLPKKKQTAVKSTTQKEKPLDAFKDVPKSRCNLKQLGKDVNDFLGDFDPEYSNRERRKIIKKLGKEPSSIPLRRSTTDSNSQAQSRGNSTERSCTVTDHCDCLEESCPGCFYPCSECSSTKCGIDCRKQRKWMLNTIWNEADQTVRYKPTVFKS